MTWELGQLTGSTCARKDCAGAMRIVYLPGYGKNEAGDTILVIASTQCPLCGWEGTEHLTVEIPEKVTQ